MKRLQATKAKIMTFNEIESLISEGGKLKGVVVVNSQTKEKKTLEVDAVLVQFGFSSSLGPIKTWPIKIENRRSR